MNVEKVTNEMPIPKDTQKKPEKEPPKINKDNKHYSNFIEEFKAVYLDIYV